MSKPIKNNRLFILAAGLLFLALILTYANHFNNSFHFDDSHTIVTNPYIRSPGNVGLFFVDGRTSSSLPANQTYRPLFTLSTAVDYFLAGGLNAFYFHLTNFIYYLAQLLLMFFLFLAVFNRVCSHEWNNWLALFGVGWYGLHAANAETVNYISARSDLLSTLFIVAAFALYIYSPRAKKYYLYLIPFVLGALVKPTALMFAPLLFVYVYLFEKRPFIKSSPAFVLAALLYVLQNRMTSPTFYPSNIPMSNYLITQPFVVLYYFKTFFLPFGLSADYDWTALSNVFDARFFIGLAFVAAMLAVAYYCSRKKDYRPISFGILWVFIALVPSSSVFSLSEVLNDHRIFFPFVGLMIGVIWAVALLLFRYEKEIRSSSTLKTIIISAAVFVLLANAIGAWYRNEVWKNEESLWHDVTVKSPKNGRGLMNYGITQMGKGRYEIALKYFKEALKYTPRYSLLHINLGIVNGAMGNQKEAEESFRQALEFAPNDYDPNYYYGRWLSGQGRHDEAARFMSKAAGISPGAALEAAEGQAKASPSPENHLNLSLAYYRARLFKDCIKAAEKALDLRPDYVEAYNNIGAAYNEMGQWEKAIAALERALELNPDFELARNNLNWAKSKLNK